MAINKDIAKGQAAIEGITADVIKQVTARSDSLADEIAQEVAKSIRLALPRNISTHLLGLPELGWMRNGPSFTCGEYQCTSAVGCTGAFSCTVKFTG